jgi:hypothetical protein
MTSADSPNATSLPGSADGPTRSDLPDGLTTGPSGRVPLPASRSASPGIVFPETIPATSPLIFSNWSGPAAPLCCLASKSQARTCSERFQARLQEALERRLHGLGSTMYRIDWKPHTTPLGRQIFRLRASGHRISASGHFSGPTVRDLPQMGWPSPTVGNATGSQSMANMSPTGRREDGSKGTVSLPGVAALTGWPTTRANDSTGDKVPPGRQGGEALKTTVVLAGWVSPTAQDGSRGGKEARPWDKGVPLSQQVVLSGWNTPQAGTPAQNGNNAAGNTDYSRSVVAALTGWNTTRATDGSNGGPNQAGGALPADAHLTGWPTATTRDHKDGPECPNVPVNALLGRAAWLTTPHRLTASGEMLTGSDAGMESGGQLSPAHSLWIQGYKAAWLSCGVRAMQSSRKSRRRSSNALNWPDLRAALDMLE